MYSRFLFSAWPWLPLLRSTQHRSGIRIWAWLILHDLPLLRPLNHLLLAPPSGNGSQFVSFTLTNNGSRVGSEVAQLYLEFLDAADEAPRQLKAYTKVHDLQPGASSKVVLELTPRDFSIWSVERKGWEMVSGVFGVVVGSSSRDHRLRGSVHAKP